MIRQNWGGGDKQRVLWYFLKWPMEQYMDVSKELRSVLLTSRKLLAKFCSLQKSLNVLTTLLFALLVDL